MSSLNGFNFDNAKILSSSRGLQSKNNYLCLVADKRFKD